MAEPSRTTPNRDNGEGDRQKHMLLDMRAVIVSSSIPNLVTVGIDTSERSPTCSNVFPTLLRHDIIPKTQLAPPRSPCLAHIPGTFATTQAEKLDLDSRVIKREDLKV